MPPRTRGVKALKENITVSSKKKNVIVKSNRKPLADKTNSASDDNNSGLISIKENTNVAQRTPESVKERSCRNRRLPTRYKENNTLKNLSNFSPVTPSSPKNASSHSQQKTTSETRATKLTPHKTPSRISSSPLISKRPKRICRLPSKFDAQSVSPLKNTSIEPSHASTPIANKSKKINVVKSVKPQTKNSNNKQSKKETICISGTRIHTGATTSAINKVRSPASNNVSVEAKNAKQAIIKKKCETNETKPTVPARSLRPKVAKNNLEANVEDIILKSVTTTNNKSDCDKNPRNNVSFRLLENRKDSLKRDSSKLDVYEFTFDPSEEPPPQKKKKKRNPRNPSKPKKVVKSTYDKNLEKALASLKQNVALKNKALTKVEEGTTSKKVTAKSDECTRKLIPNTSNTNTVNNVSKASENRYNSIRIEDIAMQFQDNTQHESVELNYSPVDTPMHAMSPVYETDGVVENAPPSNHSIDHHAHNKTPEGQIGNKDPLNLQDHISFFDEEPVASSSMNLSTRHPTASPWRVEFNNLPIKWQVNSYVKPNMTPAIERSFINYNDSQKKHVYTNIITEPNESLPQIEDDPVPQTSNLKQTSILSFIKEVVEKNANKKKKPLIIQTNSLFEDTHVPEVPSRRNKNIPDVIVEKSNTSGEDMQTDNSEHKDSSCDSEKVTTEKQSEKNKDITYFGFDESENQENVSPVKTKIKKKKMKTRKALQAINGDLNKPKDIGMPIAAMSKPARLPNYLDKVFDDAKAATEPPVFPEQHVDKDTEVTNINTDTVQGNINDEDSNSVHLFEDIELVHHVKPTRKSYGKSKKVTFQHSLTVNNFNSDNLNNGSSDEDDLEDLSFKLPSIKEKKPTKKKTNTKQKLSKKEEKEAEEWAAGFNSMCEDIDEFDLVVE
ncbi:uncharacterized protein LOC121726414 [Aricia agestis]|uniref:uncharacterized protein LOC121726414 n=1 Tax=Aricia agestis TaxID=91739 RepID=UPI001C2096E8|nr:uncharacterized protein LOC121726414 [Aricia agestis]XP_041969698.1 uncharacterized protein LOC121726414 [Aricia agestis]XP_041969699.1 uncharacterized protein LOC121726414 [Aricia agestis]